MRSIEIGRGVQCGNAIERVDAAAAGGVAAAAAASAPALSVIVILIVVVATLQICVDANDLLKGEGGVRLAAPASLCRCSLSCRSTRRGCSEAGSAPRDEWGRCPAAHAADAHSSASAGPSTSTTTTISTKAEVRHGRVATVASRA